MGESFSGKKMVLEGMGMIPDRKNRRRDQRLQVNFNTELQCANESFQCTMVDLSKMGCRVTTEKPIQNKINDVIVKFRPPRQLDPVQIKGKIRMKNQTEKGFSIGISFNRIIPNLEDFMP